MQANDEERAIQRISEDIERATGLRVTPSPIADMSREEIIAAATILAAQVAQVVVTTDHEIERRRAIHASTSTLTQHAANLGRLAALRQTRDIITPVNARLAQTFLDWAEATRNGS